MKPRPKLRGKVACPPSGLELSPDAPATSGLKPAISGSDAILRLIASGAAKERIGETVALMGGEATVLLHSEPELLPHDVGMQENS